MGPFELMSSDHFHVILHPDKEHGLIFNRLDGAITTIYYNDAKELSNLRTVGQIYGIVGKFLDKYLILIKSRSKIGSLYEPNSQKEHDIFMINQVQFIDISLKSTIKTSSSIGSNSHTNNISSDVNDPSSSSKPDEEYSMESFKKEEDYVDHDFSSLPVTFSTNSFNAAQSRANNWNPFKLANSLKPSQFLKSTLSDKSGVPSSSSVIENNDQNSNDTTITSPIQTNTLQDEADKRLLEETMKLFNNTNSFYYSTTLDLTRRFSKRTSVRQSVNEFAWVAADERFFWNKFMLRDLIDLSKQDSGANYFICVIMQGFISIEQYTKNPADLNLEFENGLLGSTSMSVIRFSKIGGNDQEDCDRNQATIHEEQKSSYVKRSSNLAEKTCQLALISRRSVFRAGTRYRRRGCDEHGNCANFVETEQIFRCKQHFTSLIILRGSIPLFWYQTGYNYRPPPVLFRTEEENHKAFTEHFQNLIYSYETEQIIVVDCTEHSGREKLLHDAYKKHLDMLRSVYPKLELIEFDFHKHCRRRQCTDTLIEKNLGDCGLTESILKNVKFYWNDGDVIWNQEGIFRVNCLDCSDRTNVVQRAIALKILDFQLARLGIIEPDACPEENVCRKMMEHMWSANGNVLSTQYCGTRALFGSGDRKLSGYLKDTYNSASRYYISKFRDVYRQAAIDAMLGVESVDRKNLLNSTSLRDQYELIHFDPIIAGRSGSALLKDVGNKFTNRLARLKGRFDGRPYTHATSSCSRNRMPVEVLETKLSDTFDEMSIDWPSTESVESCSIAIENEQLQQQQDVFARFTSCDDNFQDDDEFGQLMLSIDLADLQQLKEEDNEDEEGSSNNESSRKQKEDSSVENDEIGLTEARAIGNDQAVKERLTKVNTTTT